MAEYSIGNNNALTCSRCHARCEWDPGQENVAMKAVLPLGPESCETTIVLTFLDGPGFLNDE